MPLFLLRWCFGLCGRSNFERALTLHHITAAAFAKSSLCGTGTKSNLIFVTVLVGTDYYCHAMYRLGNIVNLPKVNFIVNSSTFWKRVKPLPKQFAHSFLWANFNIYVLSFYALCMYAILCIPFPLQFLPLVLGLSFSFTLVSYFIILWDFFLFQKNNDLVTNLSISFWFHLFLHENTRWFCLFFFFFWECESGGAWTGRGRDS